MIVLKETNTIQSFAIIPTRESKVDKLILKNETTNEIVNYDVVYSTSSWYTFISIILNLKQGHFYQATFTNNNVLVHRDKIFCTNQEVSTYSVNKDEYIATNDNIIFYE